MSFLLKYRSDSLWARPGAYPIVGHLKVYSIGQVPALQTDSWLGWKVLPWTNTLAYYEHLWITAIKSFITLGPVGRFRRRQGPPQVGRETAPRGRQLQGQGKREAQWSKTGQKYKKYELIWNSLNCRIWFKTKLS